MPPAVQPAAQPNSSQQPPPQSYGDEKQWADLEAELADELKEGEPAEEPAEEPAAPEAKEPPADEPPKPSYEQLEASYRNMHSALREGREREREARDQLRDIGRLIESLRGRREEPAAKPEPPKGPSKEDDPIGYFEHRIALLEKANQELRTGTQETQQAVQQSQQEQMFWQHVERSEAEAKTRLPDYTDAVKFLEENRWAELNRMYPDNHPRSVAMAQQQGFESPQAMRLAVINQDRVAVATQAMQLGISPAQFYYDLAKGRGYQGKANGEAPAPAPSERIKAADAKIEAARSGQKASRSLSGSGGRTPNIPSISELTALYEDDPEAADKLFDQMAKKGLLG